MILVLVLIYDTNEQRENELEGENCRFTIGLENTVDNVPFLSYENTCITIPSTIPTRSRRVIETKEDISKDIAEKMMRAWDITHNGNIKGLWEDESFRSFARSDCLMIYDLTIDYVPVEDFTQRDLYQFLQNEDYKKIDGELTTYLEYIKRSGASGDLIMPESFSVGEENGQPTISFTDKEIAVGTQYAISIVSPSSSSVTSFYESVSNKNIPIISDIAAIDAEISSFRDSLFSPTPKNNLLMFSSLNYAKSQGCDYKERRDT